MRKFLMTTLGAGALATASLANAAITVATGTNLDAGDPILKQPSATTSTINFGLNPTVGLFTSTVDFTNTTSALTSVVFGTSTIGESLFSIVLAGTGSTTGSFSTSTSCIGPCQLSLVQNLVAGTYRVTLSGNTATGGGTFTGSVTANNAVPEPATWGMMLLGFGAMGIVIRRRRQQPTLAQLA